MMENVKKNDVKENTKEIKNAMKEKDDRMVVFSDGSMMSYDMAKNPRFTESV